MDGGGSVGTGQVNQASVEQTQTDSLKPLDKNEVPKDPKPDVVQITNERFEKVRNEYITQVLQNQKIFK